jgi:hypothetical protein
MPLHNTQLHNAQLLQELEELLRDMPPAATLGGFVDENLQWFGRARAIVSQWNPITGAIFGNNVEIYFTSGHGSDQAYIAIMTVLYQVRADLKMKTGGPTSVAVPGARPLEFYDAVRRLLETALTDILFVDPYIGADFVSRYLPHVRAGVTVRLLTRKYLDKVVPSVEMLARQQGLSVEIRKSVSHDRYVFIDRRECYHSSASFQDGGKSNPALLSQVMDVFPDTQRIYESEWTGAEVVRAP